MAPNNTEEEEVVTESPATAGTPPEEVYDPLDPMLSLSEVCEIEGCSRWTIRRRVKAGKFPPGYELVNGGLGWRRSVILERRKNMARRTYGAEIAPAPKAA